MTRGVTFLIIAFCMCSLMAPVARAADKQAKGVVVNDHLMTKQEIQSLRQQLAIPENTAIPPGNYWYDPVSGLWGKKGGPVEGWILPGLQVGGPLEENASGGGTGVIINGREIHPKDLAFLKKLFGFVNPGRYWLNAYGIGGYEGGPPMFDLRAAAAASGGGGTGQGGYTQRTPFGGLGGDGNCSYYLHPGGSSVMNCN